MAPAPLMVMMAVGVGLTALFYYYFLSNESRQSQTHSATPSARSHRIYEIQECSICQEDIYNEMTSRVLTCGHMFHNRCIERWQQVCPANLLTCPNCRHFDDVSM